MKAKEVRSKKLLKYSEKKKPKILDTNIAIIATTMVFIIASTYMGSFKTSRCIIAPKKLVSSSMGFSVEMEKSALKMQIKKTAKKITVTLKFLELVITYMVKLLSIFICNINTLFI